MIRFTHNKKRVEMSESDFKKGYYIESVETDEQTEFHLKDKNGKTIQVLR